MKKQYEAVKMTLREFSETDVVRTSVGGDVGSTAILNGAEGKKDFSLDWLGGGQ